MAAGYRFLPWVRSGLAATLKQDDDRDGDVPGRAELAVGVRIARKTGDPLTISQRVSLLGPGDVVGIDPRQVIRTDPPAGATDAEPNYLVHVELDRPDLPWMFTPAAADGQQRLRPWLVLVVVEEDGPGMTLHAASGGGLPELELTSDADPARQLPDLSQSWAWAHGQAMLVGEADAADVLGKVPQRDAARLLCPRRLDPSTRYLACLVPAFNAGRLAGLGQPPAELDENLRPAWGAAPTAVTLPVYYSWRFATGGGGDFEQLARALRPRPLPATAGLQQVYVGAAGPPLPELPADNDAALVQLAGALVAPGVTAPPWPEVTRTAVTAGLEGIINAASERTDAAGSGLDGPDPVVGPPLYGQWLAARSAVPATGDEPAWLRELSLDPRHRGLAGLAAGAVRADQESLMDQAWAQVGAVEQANRELRLAQLAREVRASLLRRHVAPLEPGAVVGVTAVAHRRMRLGTATRSVAAVVRDSALPGSVVQPAFRRVTSPRGALARRLDPAGTRAPRPVVTRLDSGDLRLGAGGAPPDGLFSFSATAPARIGVPADVLAEVHQARAVARVRRPRVLRDVDVDAAPMTPQKVFAMTRALGLRAMTATDVEEFRRIVLTRARREDSLLGVPADPPLPTLGVGDLAGELLDRLDPETTVPARMKVRLRSPGHPAGWSDRTRGTDVLRDVLAAPEFPRPAWEYIRDHAPDLMLPGVRDLPQDSVTLAETNPAFAEAFLVGLNHEMARELLWREFPTDQRGTCFRRFWAPGGTDDIPAVDLWAAGLLGDHTAAAVDGSLVLLLRGRLLFRYPHTVVYAVPPDVSGRPDLTGPSVLMPLFRGRMEPDVAFCGFALDRDTARDEGWWFLLEEQPTAPRFGLDVAAGFGDDAPALNQWNDLSWSHLAADAAALAALSQIDAETPPEAAAPPGPVWGADAAAMAGILAQQPVRVAIRARDLLPPDVPHD
jgi:hypothetical protein